MSSPIISVENLSKSYMIRHESTQPGTNGNYQCLRDELFSLPRKLLSHFSSLATHTASTETFWALKDVSFHVNRGEVIGVIGRNGAGKSTLLKILSRITEPTKGKVTIRGRVASLLEVGTGFHPELTGRENIYLNGAILGMASGEIKSKFDEIVAFAGVERFLDTPVKRYSSGMYVRLAFAVAAHLEPEILVVDEVLAVGDAEFQKKCLGRMRNVASEGRTVLFVSHNMAAIRNLCAKSLFLRGGNVAGFGDTPDIVGQYFAEMNTNLNYQWTSKSDDNSTDVRIESVKLFKTTVDPEGDLNTLFITDDLTLEVTARFPLRTSSIAFEMFVSTNDGIMIFCAFTKAADVSDSRLMGRFNLPKNIFNNARYSITVGVSRNYNHWLDRVENAIQFEMHNVATGFGWQGSYEGIVRPQIESFLMNV